MTDHPATYAEQFSDAALAKHYQLVSAMIYARNEDRPYIFDFDLSQKRSDQLFAANLAEGARQHLFLHLGVRGNEDLDEDYGL